jgi:hypothetical protein
MNTVDRFIEVPHHFYASSFCTWKTDPDIREVIKYMDKEGYEYTTHIASTIVEVNEIIAAAMVAFQLENS